MKKLSNRALVLFLTFTLIVSLVPSGLFGLTAAAATDSAFDRVSDHESIDYWKGYFSNGAYNSDVWSDTISTKNAGAVWTDKSVFVPQNNKITIDGVDVPITDTGDNFLVSMSLMASNKTVRGYEYIPTSTMLVLDVSGSMGNGQSGNRSWDEMVEAANKAIDTLLNLNNNNQIGVVLYSGNSQEGSSDIDHSTLLLPLGRYTTTAVNNNGTAFNGSDDYPEYLTASNSTVGINSAVSPRTTGSKSVTGGTYIQGGIYRAMEELISADAPKKVTEGVQAGMAYTPIVVLMSDGAPTAANLDYDFNGNDSDHKTDMGNGTSTNERMGFLTQLTAAYAKARIDGAYEKETLFYTLGLGLNGLNSTQQSVAEAVLDPGKNTGNLDEYWDEYLALDNDPATRVGNTMYLTTNGNAVVKSDYVTSEYKNYVTQFFEAVSSQNVSLEQSLLNAFQQIVDTIVLQSVYYPTEIAGGSADLGGYVTFRDELGEYMDVKNVKGILFEDENGSQTLHTGAKLAKNFVPGGGDLGQSSNPKELGDELVNAVKERLGIAETLTAQNLIRNAYYYGQLAYVDDNNFSNYIGYYGDADGNFIDFWHEGHTLTEQNAAIAKGAKFIYKAYGYLGEVNEDLGIKASDMMYTTINVRKTIADDVAGSAVGEIVVEGSIPAALIPTITYEITLEGKTYESGIKSLAIKDTSAKFPARLVYEVGLRSDINPINIAEKVNNNHKNQDGTYTFYTNDWAFVDYENGAIADTSVNAFTHFEPAEENERYYYITDSVVYSAPNENAVYTGTSKPTGDGYYHSYRVFSVTNGIQIKDELTFIKTSADALSHAVQNGNGWVIPAGTGKHEIVGYEVETKNDNKTNTNRFIIYPKIKTDAENPSGEHSHHFSVVTFGNNGRLTVTPATGIKISKALDVPSSTTETFEFKISGAVANEGYIVTPLDANGNFGTASTVIADSAGVITVQLKAGDSVYVTGLAAGTYTVTESNDTAYRVLTINGQESASSSTTVTVEQQKTSAVDFVNTLKGYGSIYISKEVINSIADEDLPGHAMNAEFDITVDVGTALANKEFYAAHSSDSTLTKVTVGNDGKITGLKLKHGETIVIRNLPENTVAEVTENLSSAQASNYTASYLSHNKAGETMDNDGEVIISKDNNATVVINNTYKPASTNVTINFTGEKTMDATHLANDKTFTFALEKLEGKDWVGVSGWNASATVEAGKNETVDINFNNFSLALDLDKSGTHSYRIYENKPTTPDEITYDPAIHTFVVTAVDNNGQLEATVTGHTVSRSNNGYVVDADFKNSYDTATVVIDVNKTVTDSTKNQVSFAGYEFELYEANNQWAYNDADLVDTGVTDQNGDARFSWLVDSADAGTHCYVLKEKVPTGYTEPSAPDYYGWKYDTAERHITVVVSVDNGIVSTKVDNFAVDAVAEYSFENVYKAKEATVSLENIATKTLNGRDLAAGEFTFRFTDASGQLLAVGKNTAAADDGKASPIKFFVPDGNNNATNQEFKLVYTHIGTHHYKISEVAGNKGGVDYTSRIFDMVVEVTDNGAGALVANYYFEDSTYTTVNFVNEYSVKTPTSIQLEATKKLTGDRQMLSSEFHFNVYEMTDDTFSVKKSDTAVATGSNTGALPDAQGVAEATFKFSPITYTQPGVYYYQISEVVQDSNLGTAYDKTPQNVIVTVKDNLDGTITASVNKDADDIVFTNVYTPKPVSVRFVGEKVLTGRELADKEFEFALFKATVATVGEDTVWTAGAKVDTNVKNAANGNILFPEVEFTSKGTYRYIAKEIIGTKGGVNYDETEFHITVTVTDDFKGTLSAHTIITDNQGDLSQIVFNNDYRPKDKKIVLEGEKTLFGRDMEEGEFSFVIKEGEAVVAEGKNKAAEAGDAAEIEFEAIEYTASDVGKHTYTVEEAVPDEAVVKASRVTFDKRVYNVVVEVKDDGNGNLIISDPVITKSGSSDVADTIEFENTYTPKPDDISVDITAHKTVVNKGSESIGPEDFNFSLENTETGDKVTEKSNTKGDAMFTLDFSEDDIGKTYTYKLTEVNDAKANVEYSTAEYEITVKVSLGADNKLVADLTLDEETVASVVAEFENVYDHTPKTPETPKQPEEPKASEAPKNPQTGDNTKLGLWIALLFISGTGVIGTAIYGKKKKESEEL